jgi:hypothetical protein
MLQEKQIDGLIQIQKSFSQDYMKKTSFNILIKL